ncbi:MAG: restriction endonuclease subunit S [Brevibacterium aurantiacum]
MTLTLGSVGATYGGLTGKSGKDFGHGTGRYVTFTEVMSASRLIGRSLERVNVHRYERQHEVRRGDVLFNGSSETPEEVALGAVVDFDVPRGVYLNSFCFGYRLTQPNEVDPTYLAYFFRSAVGRDIVFGLAQGATRYNIAKTKLLKTPLDLPSYEQQKAIAATLSQLDDAIVSLERLITKKRAIKQGMMQELLTGRTRLPGFDGEWVSIRLGSLLTVRNGRSQRDVEVTSGRYPILATGGEIGRTNTAIYTKPSVLIGRKGTIDRPQYQETPFWTVDTLFYTEVGSRADARYLYYLCTTIDWMSLNEATGVPSLTGKRIESVEVFVPGIDEQQAIAAVIGDADAEILALERRLEATRDIKQGMMQELLTGRTRLPVDEEMTV